MFDFMKGEKVRVTGGRHKGKTGVATGNGSQISASDWPEIQIKDDEDGFCFWAYTDDVELVDDRYEYKVQHQLLDSRFGGWSDSGLGMWVDEEKAVDRFNRYVESEKQAEKLDGVRDYIYRIVRRPKGSETVYRTEDEDV